MKHLEVRQLWLREHKASRYVVHLKVHRELNLADDLTHHWSEADGMKQFFKMRFQTASQRGSLAEGECETSRPEQQAITEPAPCAIVRPRFRSLPTCEILLQVESVAMLWRRI